MSKQNITLVGVVIALILGVLGLVGGNNQPVSSDPSLGAGTRFPNGLAVGSTADVTKNKLTVGNSGTAIGGVNFGTCSILANASITATTTKNFDCVASDVVAGDKIFITQVSSSTLASQYVIKGAVASSTNGYITFSILNLTGGSAVPAATNGFGSSTAFMSIR